MKLSEYDRALVEDSIAHWERMRGDIDCGEGPRAGDCPLCMRYCPDPGAPGYCDGCPVAKRVGLKQCRRTPFRLAEDAWGLARDDDWWIPDWQDKAQKEIDFLKTLLEDE